jgi:hypothetical protein
MLISRSLQSSARSRILASWFAAALLLLLGAPSADAQARERPVAFDSAGRIMSMTPPLAARLGLSAPLWPVSGDYIDSRLYAIDAAGGGYVLVVQRQREVLERYAMDTTRRRQLAAVIDSATMLARAHGGPDANPTFISEPVRSTFVINQTLLGALVFGPAAAVWADEPTASPAAYLAITGGMFFVAANMTQTSTVSRAQNHLSWHSARRGAIAAGLLMYSATGDDNGSEYAATTLAGGIAGDVLGFVLAKPMTDAEAHGTSHGSTVTAAVTAATLGSVGMFDGKSANRVATAAVVGVGALGYPLGLRYVRTAPYRVTAGDVGTLVTTEFLGMGVAATLLGDDADPKLGWGLVGSGFVLGAIAGDQLLVRPFDHTESDARLLQYGAVAGALVGGIIPVIAQSDNAHVIYGSLTAGAILGAILTEQFIAPPAANTGLGAAVTKSREVAGIDVKFSPESLVFAKMGVKGQHSILSLTF